MGWSRGSNGHSPVNARRNGTTRLPMNRAGSRQPLSRSNGWLVNGRRSVGIGMQPEHQLDLLWQDAVKRKRRERICAKEARL